MLLLTPIVPNSMLYYNEGFLYPYAEQNSLGDAWWNGFWDVFLL